MQTLFIIFLSALGIQLIYLTFFLLAFSKRRSNQLTSQPPVSVIVCAHDEEENLRKLIPELLKQEYPSFEVIIVNDRSNDGTYDFLLAETKKHERLRMVHVSQKPDHVNGKKYALTLGIKAARHDWVLLTDADCRPNSDQWIVGMSNQFSDQHDIVLGCSPYTKENGLLNLFIRYESVFTALQYVAFALLGNPYMGVGRNLAYRKTLFLANKGFHDRVGITGGDDDLFVNRHANSVNTAVSLGERALVYSIPQNTYRDFFRQKVRHLAVGKKYKPGHQWLLGLFTISHVVTWLTGLILLPLFSGFLWVLAGLFFRGMLLTVTIHQAVRQFGHKFEFWFVPLLDFLFVIYYLSTAPVALITKKVRWRN